ncbi:hypothetical protein C3V36_10980 [Lachnospiraceae bacterium oral taxon 500]|nr:hypothetical protein C3V36_10980 [Lachnospiraceae bacterium oral taxon 500]
MHIGEIVNIKRINLLGEVLAIDDMDRVTLRLTESGLKVIAEIGDLSETGSNQPQRESGKTVNILGTIYKILIVEEEDYRKGNGADGWCDPHAKELLIYNFKQDIQSVKDLVAYQKEVLRHEIIHAFLYESGLWGSSENSTHWALNEEMVDWIAIQEPKLHKAFKEAGCDG